MRDDDFGPWIDHDGKDCPADVMGSVIRVHIECAGEDSDGHVLGDIVTQTVLVTHKSLKNPLWDWSRFGNLINMKGGDIGICGRVVRYRIRKDPHVELMRKKAASIDGIRPGALRDPVTA